MDIETGLEGIAIIGLAGKFPGAANVNDFWGNLLAGRESISFFSDEELIAAGLDAKSLRQDANNVLARGVLKGAEWFDASFFGIQPKEAEVMDPQQRLFLETSWEAMEDAGYDLGRFSGLVSIFGGGSSSSYYMNNIYTRPDVVKIAGSLWVAIGNEKDFLATRVAHKLNLKGPAINVNTACSTSLVAVCQACQSLLNYQCDMALAGGVSINFPQKQGYYYYEGGTMSPDGHCRPMDERAGGTVPSDGVGVVVLKRLAEAVNDGDHIYAVIKGIGINNDGSTKVSFTALSVEGQAEAIRAALAQADCSPATISYVEAHGTATSLGDPIEIAGLTQAFRGGTDKNNFCALGSLKGNIGHTDAASGVAGLIKTALALKHKMLPASLNYERPNPKIDFASSPFYVNAALREWKDVPLPRRAGVSSFGVGGTNAHVVLEEAPVAAVSGPIRSRQLLVLSAKSGPALEAATDNLVEYLKENPKANLGDVAYTLAVGRNEFNYRRMVVCRDVSEAIAALETRDASKVFSQMAGSGATRSSDDGKEHDVPMTLEGEELSGTLNALGRLWLGGGIIKWGDYYKGERRCRLSLPTYPFERKRFWIEPGRTNEGGSKLSDDKPKGEENGVVFGSNGTGARREQIQELLRNQFEELSGMKLAGVDAGMNFREMGFDSLSLAQAVQTINRRLGVRLALHKVLNDITTLKGLAEYIDSRLETHNWEKIELNGVNGTSSLGHKQAVTLPSTPEETALTDVWRKTLGLDSVGADEDFFELDGEWLTAVRLIRETNKVLRADLRIQDLFKHPTIRELSAAAAKQNGKKRGPMMFNLSADADGGDLPVIFIGVGYWEGFLETSLGWQLRERHEVFATDVPMNTEEVYRALENEKTEIGILTIKENARAHAELIKKHGFKTPVILSGFCHGGLLAYEVGHQLEAAGVAVAGIFLIDTRMAIKPLLSWRIRLGLKWHGQKIKEQGAKYLWIFARRKLGWDKQNREPEPAAQLAENAANRAMVRENILPWNVVEVAITRTQKNYRLRKINCWGVVIRCVERDKTYDEFDQSHGAQKWFKKGVRVVDVPGDHHGIFDPPNLRIMAKKIEECLENFKANKMI